MAATLCLGLLLMVASSIEAQAPPSPIMTSNGVSNLTIYIKSLEYSDELSDKTSFLYQITSSAVSTFMSSVGATVTNIIFSDGGGCLKTFLEWTGGVPATQTDFILEAQQEGANTGFITIYFNFQGCDGEEPMEITNTTLYLSGQTYSNDLHDPKSQLYMFTRAVFENAITATGGTLEHIEFKDGGGSCIVVWLHTRGGDLAAQSEFLTNITRTGIEVAGQRINVSFTECDHQRSDNMTSTTLYLPGLDYSTELSDPQSELFLAAKAVIVHILSPTGTTLNEIAFTDGGGCLRVWFQTRGGDLILQSQLLTNLTRTGVEFFGQMINVSFNECQRKGDDSMASATIYLSGLTYSKELGDSESALFLATKAAFTSILGVTGAELEEIDFADGGGCLRVWFQTRGGDVFAQSELLNNFTRTGLEVFGQMINVSFKECQNKGKPDHQLELKVYISGFPWLKEYEDHTTLNFLILQSDLQSALESLFGFLVHLEISLSGDCLLLHIQWKLEGVDEKTMSLIEERLKDGLWINNTLYNVDTESCPADRRAYLCNLINCGVNGHCINNTAGREWEICSCNPGFGGLFCENNMTDYNLTDCDRMRRFGLFVHHQITGKGENLPSMNVTIKEILMSLRQKSYHVPYCYPSNSRDNFYSMCEYDAMTGYQLKCHCVNGNGMPNYWHYAGEGDCRVHSEYLAKIRIELFIHNFDWSDDLYMDDSEVPTSIKSQIEKYMAPAGGYLDELELSPWGINRCVHVGIQYRAENRVQGQTLLHSLPGEGVMLQGENKTLSLFPCADKVDVNVCPIPPPGSFHICLFECGAGYPCEDGLTCCNTSCGQGACRELGFLQKMKVNLTMSLMFMSEYEDRDSQQYTDLQENIKEAITELMAGDSIEGFGSIKILGFERAKSWEKRRKRRQAEEEYTTILLEFLFTTEIPVDKFMLLRDFLLEYGIDYESTNFEVVKVALGKGGKCGEVNCFYDSVCVERFGGMEQCACPKGRAGRNCQLTVCQNPDGSSMCENNAPCVYDGIRNSYKCQCEPGYHGTYCQTKVCDLFRPDACNDGTCVGDIMDMKMCHCPPGKGGLFCQYNMDRSYNHTYCEKHHAFASYIVSILNGSNPGAQLGVDVSQLLPLFNATRNILLLPTCRYDNPDRLGEYHFYCAYDTKTGMRSMDQDCMCANGDGTPNYWTYHNGQCVVYVDVTEKKPCDRNPCANGAVCHNMPNNKFNCICAPGFHGKTCEDHHQDQCPHGGSPLYKSFGLWTCGTNRPCPFGFHCHGSSFNGSCCFKPDFICDLDLCQNNSTCIGDVHSGILCQCPPGRSGLFCENNDDGVRLTQCQKQQQLNSWLERMLRTGSTPKGTTLNAIRQILVHLEVHYVPLDMCDDEGAFKTRVEGASVLNVNEVKDLCFDEDGNDDPLCKDVVCDAVQALGFCMNGGRCVGDFTSEFCDCTNTGFHGTRCEKSGASDNRTECLKVRDLIHFAMGIVNGSVQIFHGIDISGAVLDLFELTQIESVFEPYCDAFGQYAYRGCAHSLPDLKEKVCYCTSEDFQQVGDASNYMEPPEECPLGRGDCPLEWGPDCKRPEWWCTEDVQCKMGEQKCYFAVECDEKECSKMPKVSCVPEELKLPCEPKPCEHDRYKMCPPCGEDASCFHIAKGDEDKGGMVDKGDGSNKKDDNDSAEKHRSGLSEENDHSDSTSWMRPKTGQNYICECPTGRTGPNCEVHEDVCKMVPASMCPHGCIGDLEHGVLCRCEEGYAGLTCDKIVRTPCEIRQAFYGDSLDVLRGLFTVPGFDSAEMKMLVQVLVELTDGDSIPDTKCTDNGFYEKVQCNVNIYSLDQSECYCVNQGGEYIASNILPHTGYDVCTGPLDMRTFVGLCFRQDIQLCQNGGSCVFDLYEGSICTCPPGYRGQFCEEEGHGAQSESLCEFMRDAFYFVHEIFLRNGTMQNPATSHQLEIMAYFIDININGTARARGHALVGLRYDCHHDGNFMHYVCDHDIITDERLACYCLVHSGPLIGTEAADQENLDCSDVHKQACHELDNCLDLTCEHGHRHNLQYCPICECKHPCEGFKCQRDEKCVVKDLECDKDDGKCTKPVCLARHKPGVCPGHRPERISSIWNSLMANASIYDNDRCQVSCHDDTDCEGTKKCCGLCGNMCVEPEESDDCTDQYEIMMEYLEFIRESRNLYFGSNTTQSLLKIIDQTEEINEIWVPSCSDSNYVPVQCLYNVSALLMGTRMTTQCFCVDRLGHRIKDSHGQFGNESSCDVKPFICPILHPSTDDDASDECTEDMDCAKNSKCCYDGFHHMCSEPAPEIEDNIPINMLMDNVCSQRPDICPSGSCLPMWESEGRVCNCDAYEDRVGPFCERPKTLELPKPRTACERKRITAYLFWESLGKILTMPTNPLNYSKIEEIAAYFIGTMLQEVPEDEREKIPIIMYDCEEDGSYKSVQCELSMFTEKGLECFCVDEQGKELPGTRTPYGETHDFCRRDKMCDMGHALHASNGNLLTCNKDNQCPFGYSCARGMYGNLYCCPNKEEKRDICNHPVDIGYECEHGTAGDNYYYDEESSSCESFNFRGCGGNRNHFKTMDDCMRRCVNMTHLGMCPARPVKVATHMNCNQNLCEQDGDCPSDSFKCCNSTCGKRCILAIYESPEVGQCPIGLPKQEPKVCYHSSQCGDGYRCHFKEDDVANFYRKGFCCLDVEDINYCLIKPLVLEHMTDDSDEDKDEDDDNSDEKTEDKDKGDDENMSEHGLRPKWQPCEKPMPRYYYNDHFKQCEMYHGCEEDFNTFETREDCCRTCSTETRCKEGRCPKVNPSNIAVSCTDECVYDHDCPGQRICCNTGCSMRCVQPHDEMNSTCLAEHRAAKKAQGQNRRESCSTVYIPSCEENGDYARQQCHSSFGICWCVTTKGNYIEGSLTRGVATCNYFEGDMTLANLYPVSVHDVEFEVCPQEERIHCCEKNLCEKRCHAHPEAMCRINPCGGCKAEFFDADNNIVNCEEGLTTCQLELQDSLKIVKARRITAHMDEREDEDEEEKERRLEMAENVYNEWGSTIRHDIPLKCQKLPDPGECEGFARRWYYNPQTKKCNMFIWGMCGGNSNKFSSPKECYDECDTKNNPCSTVLCGAPKEMCTLTFDEDCYDDEEGCVLEATCTERETDTNHVSGVFVPRCLSSGAYNYKQCLGHLCWCVDDNGEYTGGLSSNAFYGDLECTSSGPSNNSVFNLPDCPAGSYAQKPQSACLKACSEKVCPGAPRAECKVDLCSQSCTTMFEDDYGNAVRCEDDGCQAFSFDTEGRDDCADQVLCNGGNVKNCPTDVCENAQERLCPQNPCAVCRVDSCTCEPYFIDVMTSERLNIKSSVCRYLTKGSCTTQTCKLKLDNVPDSQLPQCTSSGSFRAKQCADSFCFCVGAEGNFLQNISTNGNCEEIDEIALIYLRLVFDADFDSFQRLGKLNQLKEAVRNKLIIVIGVPEGNIRYISDPYRGSIKVDVEIADTEDGGGNIGLVANSISQRMQNGDFNIEVDGQTLGLIEDETTFVQSPASLVNIEDDDGLSDKEIIIIAACAGGAAFLILITVICCCCCRKSKKPEVVDDTYDHIRERRQNDKNVYDNPPTMYNNKSFEGDDHYMEVGETDRYMKVRL